MQDYVYGRPQRPNLSLAVVVGAGGMGMAVARRLAQHHRILLADFDLAKAQAETASLNAGGAEATAIHCDITDDASTAQLATAVEALGGLGVLVHVAGLSPSAGDFGRILTTNLAGPVRTTRALLPLAREGSAAILVGSMAGHSFDRSTDISAILADPLSDRLVERAVAAVGPEQANPGTAYVLSKYALIVHARPAPLHGASAVRASSRFRRV